MFSYSESFSLVLEIIVSPRNGMSINRFEQSEVEREQIADVSTAKERTKKSHLTNDN